jgi:hypothetical protein
MKIIRPKRPGLVVGSPTDRNRPSQVTSNVDHYRAELRRRCYGILEMTVPECVPSACTDRSCRRTQMCQQWRRNIVADYAWRPQTYYIKLVRTVLLQMARNVTASAMRRTVIPPGYPAGRSPRDEDAGGGHRH